MCDGLPQCPYGEDEENCGKKSKCNKRFLKFSILPVIFCLRKQNNVESLVIIGA